jgi:3',5'-cyclic AMP phosphodiesterase CpdA
MTKLIVFTDLHMVPAGEAIIGIDPHERLVNGIRHVNQHHGDAAHVMITGDLTDRGDAASFSRLRMALRELAIPHTLLIGNHDRRDTFLEVFTNVPVDENGFVQRVVDLDTCRLVALDTLNAPPYGAAEAVSGFLCDQRLAWLDRQLSTADARPVLIFMHHPPHATGFAGMDTIRLQNDDAFYAVLQKHGIVRHVFAGHVHRTISGSCRRIPFSIFKSTVHQQPMTFDSLDTSLAADEPAAYGIVLTTDDGILVHTEDYEISVPALPEEKAS